MSGLYVTAEEHNTLIAEHTAHGKGISTWSHGGFRGSYEWKCNADGAAWRMTHQEYERWHWISATTPKAVTTELPPTSPVYVGTQWTIPGEMTLAELADKLDAVGLDWALSSLTKEPTISALTPKGFHPVLDTLTYENGETLRQRLERKKVEHGEMWSKIFKMVGEAYSPESEPVPKARFFMRVANNGVFVYDGHLLGGHQTIAGFWFDGMGEELAERWAFDLVTALNRQETES